MPLPALRKTSMQSPWPIPARRVYLLRTRASIFRESRVNSLLRHAHCHHARGQPRHRRLRFQFYSAPANRSTNRARTASCLRRAARKFGAQVVSLPPSLISPILCLLRIPLSFSTSSLSFFRSAPSPAVQKPLRSRKLFPNFASSSADPSWHPRGRRHSPHRPQLFVGVTNAAMPKASANSQPSSLRTITKLSPYPSPAACTSSPRSPSLAETRSLPTAPGSTSPFCRLQLDRNRIRRTIAATPWRLATR